VCQDLLPYIVEDNPRLADITEATLRVSVETSAAQIPDRRRRVLRELGEIDVGA
jgi:hypothetical protein